VPGPGGKEGFLLDFIFLFSFVSPRNPFLFLFLSVCACDSRGLEHAG